MFVIIYGVLLMDFCIAFQFLPISDYCKQNSYGLMVFSFSSHFHGITEGFDWEETFKYHLVPTPLPWSGTRNALARYLRADKHSQCITLVTTIMLVAFRDTVY